ncbi:SAV_915 family protein [Streptomyces sp. NPDC003691]
MTTLTPEATASGDGADPDERRPAGPLYVPVRTGSAGGHQLRFLRTPAGVRTAVGFSSPLRLTAALGPDARWIRLAEPALRSLAEPLGVFLVTVDPRFTAPFPTASRPAAEPGPAAGLCARRRIREAAPPAAPEHSHTASPLVHPFLD